MILIDADALYEKAAKREKEAMEALLKCDANEDHEMWLKLNEVLIERAVFKSDIVDAPAIEERKTGEWIEYDSHCECSFCHSVWWYVENKVEFFNYCPNCGARMIDEIDNGGDNA